MTVVCPPDPGQTAERPLPASETVRVPLTHPLLSSQALRSLPQEKGALPVTVGVASAGVDLQNQVPVEEQIADSPLPVSETVKPFLAYPPFPAEGLNPPQQ